MKSLKEYICEMLSSEEYICEMSDACVEAKKCQTFGELLEKVYGISTDEHIRKYCPQPRLDFTLPYSEKRVTKDNVDIAIKGYREIWDTPIKVKVKCIDKRKQFYIGDVIDKTSNKHITYIDCTDEFVEEIRMETL